MTHAHVDEVSRLHNETLTGLLTQLGPGTITAFYMGALRSPHAIGLVEVESGHVRGFVFGSPRPDLVRRDAGRRNIVGTGLAVFTALLKRPARIGPFLNGASGRPDNAFDPQSPELIYLAVAPGVQGSGVGAALVNAFNDVMRASGAREYELSVDEGNNRAIAFYDRLGFREVSTYDEFGIRHRRYQLTLSRH